MKGKEKGSNKDRNVEQKSDSANKIRHVECEEVLCTHRGGGGGGRGKGGREGELCCSATNLDHPVQLDQ